MALDEARGIVNGPEVTLDIDATVRLVIDEHVTCSRDVRRVEPESASAGIGVNSGCGERVVERHAAEDAGRAGRTCDCRCSARGSCRTCRTCRPSDIGYGTRGTSGSGRSCRSRGTRGTCRAGCPCGTCGSYWSSASLDTLTSDRALRPCRPYCPCRTCRASCWANRSCYASRSCRAGRSLGTEGSARDVLTGREHVPWVGSVQ